MKRLYFIHFSTILLLLYMTGAVSADERRSLYEIGAELEQNAVQLAADTWEHFRGQQREFGEAGQGALFRSDAFSSSCRLFQKLCDPRGDYFPSAYLRQNLYDAYLRLKSDFFELEDLFKRAGMNRSAVPVCRRLIEELNQVFSSWPSSGGIPDLHLKYFRGKDGTVYLIERSGKEGWLRRAFFNLESLWRYHTRSSREGDPKKYMVEISQSVLSGMAMGDPITETFEGVLVTANRRSGEHPVYLVRMGSCCRLGSPRVLERFGGWKKVVELPREIIESFPEGEWIDTPVS